MNCTFENTEAPYGNTANFSDWPADECRARRITSRKNPPLYPQPAPPKFIPPMPPISPILNFSPSKPGKIAQRVAPQQNSPRNEPGIIPEQPGIKPELPGTKSEKPGKFPEQVGNSDQNSRPTTEPNLQLPP